MSLLCRPPILSHVLFLNLPFCACPPLTCSRRTEGRSALEQLYFLLTCSFPLPTPAEGKVHTSSACLVLHSAGKGVLPEGSLHSSAALPPAFIEGSQAGHTMGNMQRPDSDSTSFFLTWPLRTLHCALKPDLEELANRREGKAERVKKGANNEQNTQSILWRSRQLRTAAYYSLLFEKTFQE